MTPEGMREWRDSEAFADYRKYRDAQRYDGYTDYVWRRALSVIEGEASDEIRRKVHGYNSRHLKQNEAGERRFGSGRDAVSAWTAALRNWGYDPTGRYA